VSAREAARWKKRLERDAAAWDINLDAGQLDAFWRYLALLESWNRRLNLTAVTGSEAVRVRHFLDSLSCLLATGDLGDRRLVDVGSGAGFPGLPLKICCPSLRLTLVESVAKKARFLEAVVAELALEAVTVLPERAETVGRLPGHRHGYDWAVARAVAPLPTLAEYLLPLCRTGGFMLAQKGPDVAQEAGQAVEALRLLGGSAPRLETVHLPEGEGTRCLVVVEKVAPTPEQYPRRAGLPAKRPLGGPGI
jgi:16S rRNA (guanine527-N7)-methyltransferase